ncbi:alpha-amylase family glycosyl hydrolase [Alkalibacterium kapii]|nr:alpha-amylase family glycosyl hydrolase [Alkalibacterium kapii]
MLELFPNPDNKKYVTANGGHANQPGIDEFLTEFVDKTIGNYDVMTVGEAGGAKFEEAKHWVDETDGYFDMIFQFDHLGLWKAKDGQLDIEKLKDVLTKWQTGLQGKGWNALYLENHDQPRSVSTWGEDTDLRKTSAKAFATFYFLMQGTPFIYQGQEIGMTNIRLDSIDDYNDVSMKNRYKTELEDGKTHEELMSSIWKNARDNARTPMQWSDAPQAGFTTGTPWFSVNANYPDINVKQAVKDPESIYHYYKKMIEIRKNTPALIFGSYELLAEEHPQVYSYLRLYEGERYVVIVNPFNAPTEIDLGKGIKVDELLLSNYSIQGEMSSIMQLESYEARVYKLAE